MTKLSTRLAELRDWHLVVTCGCRGFPQHVHLERIATDYGGRLTLEQVMMKLRCSRCQAPPIRVTAGQGDPFVKRAQSVVLLEPQHSRR
jgi:hypothetical protein